MTETLIIIAKLALLHIRPKVGRVVKVNDFGEEIEKILND